MATVKPGNVTIRLSSTKDAEIVPANGVAMDGVRNKDIVNGKLHKNQRKDPSNSQKPPPMHKQDQSTDSTDYGDYFNEVSQVEISEDTHSDDEVFKTPIEGELEISWLKEAGFHRMASQIIDGQELAEDMIAIETATLTKKQTAAVRKRVDALNATIHRHSKVGHGDVRGIFSIASDQQQDSQMLPSCLRSPNSAAKMSHRKVAFSANLSSSGQPVARKESRRVSTIVQLSSRGKYTMQGHTDQQDIETISIITKELDSPEACPDGRKETLHFLVDAKGSTSKKDGLPNFILECNDVGMTNINQLSLEDRKMVRSLCLIEVTAMLDAENITVTRRASKKKAKDSGIFKVPLETLLENDKRKSHDVTVPLFFTALIEHLERWAVQEEGVLRVPGSVTRMKNLRQEIEDKFYSGRFKWDDVHPHDAVGLLKQFIRDLPVPLLTNEYIDSFLQVDTLKDSSRSKHLQALNLLVLVLSEVHRETLRVLLAFLKKIVDHNGNKMTLNNVAMVMAPNLFAVHSGPNTQPFDRPTAEVQRHELQLAAQSSNVIRMMIKYQAILYTVPAYILTQVRIKYEAQAHESNTEKLPHENQLHMWFLGSQSTDNLLATGSNHGVVIRVQAPCLSKGSTAVQLHGATTAKDIVAKFCSADFTIPTSDLKKNKSNHCTHAPAQKAETTSNLDSFFARTHLYEVGGNIGSRQLDHSVKMLQLVQINPGAQWIVRTEPA